MSPSWSARRISGSLASARAAYVVIPAAASASLAFGPTPTSWVRSSAAPAAAAAAARPRAGGLGGAASALLRDLDLVVLDDLFAAELLDRRHDERHQRGRRRGGQRAVDEEGLLGRDGLLDHPDRVGPVALVQDEEGALALVDFLRDLAHELVVDADVVEAVAQAVQDATSRAADDRAGRAEDERPDDDAERAATGEALRAAEVGRLMDLDPAEPGPVRDRRVDDLHVRVDVVDLLDALQELTRLLALVEHEHGEGLSIVFAHRSSLLSSRDGGMRGGGDARSPGRGSGRGCRSRRDLVSGGPFGRPTTTGDRSGVHLPPRSLPDGPLGVGEGPRWMARQASDDARPWRGAMQTRCGRGRARCDVGGSHGRPERQPGVPDPAVDGPRREPHLLSRRARARDPPRGPDDRIVFRAAAGPSWP